ncbi:hypothetical protein BC938DRAFT_481557 [Jimgerdemannia flammicorona]|uniref:Uncharacterized protein n=1 Tax=Jimgerdemannia flammicorona TaxID=994334 RepID=A0A433QFU0_9FUNG|nr:hypothetical protein BC938DRAFT_481557 [Jimgerdemannia flammicorona]
MYPENPGIKLKVTTPDPTPTLNSGTYLPPKSAPFIASNAIAAASGVSNSMKQNPLCFPVAGSTDMLTLLMEPNWPKTALMWASLSSKLMEPT